MSDSPRAPYRALGVPTAAAWRYTDGGGVGPSLQNRCYSLFVTFAVSRPSPGLQRVLSAQASAACPQRAAAGQTQTPEAYRGVARPPAPGAETQHLPVQIRRSRGILMRHAQMRRPTPLSQPRTLVTPLLSHSTENRVCPTERTGEGHSWCLPLDVSRNPTRAHTP